MHGDGKVPENADTNMELSPMGAVCGSAAGIPPRPTQPETEPSMSFLSKATALWAVAAAAFLAIPAVATAEQTAPQAVLAQAAQPNDEELESFAAAAVQVEQILQVAQQQLQGVESEDARDQLIEQAQTLMEDAVQEEGLTVEQYNVLAQLVSEDADLNQRVQQMIAEELGG
jgi:hypothetical protein